MIGDNAGILPVYQKFAPRYSQIVPIFKNIMKKYSKMIDVRFVEFPPCVLGEKARKNIAYLMTKEYLLPGAKSGKAISRKKILSQEFVVFAKCKKCFYRKTCYGVRKEYVDIYGNKEFVPIR